MPGSANHPRGACPPRPPHRAQIQVEAVGDRTDKVNSVGQARAYWETCESTRHGTLGCTRRLDSRRGGWAAIRVPGVPTSPELGSGREVRFPRTW